jgi:molecular chaperone GrpE (heat shock protein)
MKKVESKVEEAKVQITSEELKTIKKQQEDLAQLLKDIGFLETQKHGLNHKYAGVVQDIEDFKTKLEKEYGAVNISLEDGTCTPIEQKSE